MARPELGIKRVCPTTGRKFYDLGRDPIVSPYTGEALPRASFEPALAARGAVGRARVRDEEEEVETVPVGPETVSLEEVGATEEEAAVVGEDEAGLAEDVTADDAFLEEEEEGGSDVADLIDGDIENDEEA